MHHVQAEPGSLAHAFGRKKGLEDARLHLGRNSRTVVGDLHKHVIIFSCAPCEKMITCLWRSPTTVREFRPRGSRASSSPFLGPKAWARGPGSGWTWCIAS